MSLGDLSISEISVVELPILLSDFYDPDFSVLNGPWAVEDEPAWSIPTTSGIPPSEFTAFDRGRGAEQE